MIVRLPEPVPATYEWFRGSPDARTEVGTVLSIDTEREQAYIEWQPVAGQRGRRLPMWAALDRLTFDGMTVVHVLADADRARQARARRATFALVPALTEV